MKYSKVFFICNILTLGYLIVPIFYLIFIPQKIDVIVEFLYYSDVSYVVVNVLSLISFVFWIKCIVYWNNSDKKISSLLFLIFFTIIFTPFYYLFEIRKKQGALDKKR